MIVKLLPKIQLKYVGNFQKKKGIYFFYFTGSYCSKMLGLVTPNVEL